MTPHPKPPPGADASSVARVRYLREWIRGYARMLAAWHLAGYDADEPYTHQCEVYLAVTQHAQICGYPFEDGALAGKAEWRDACEHARRMLATLKSRMWPLGRADAATPQIVAEAQAVNGQFGTLLPRELLLERSGEIIRAAAPYRRSRYGKRFAA